MNGSSGNTGIQDRENNLSVIIYGFRENGASPSRYLPLNTDVDCEITRKCAEQLPRRLLFTVQ